MQSMQQLILGVPHMRVAVLILALLGSFGPNAEASLANVTGAIQVSLAGDHRCVLLSNYDVQCWGSLNSSIYLSAVTVSALHNVEMIATGHSFTCALLSGGAVKCFGSNAQGQLGNGTSDDSDLPVDVTGIATATSVIANGAHACALLSDQTAKCWGDNSQGQLGHGSATYSATPVAVDGLTGAIAMAASQYQTCAVLSSGSVSCWGTNFSGTNLPPQLVGGITTAVSIAAASEEMCVVLGDRTARCWGTDNYGQLGDGARSNGSAAPVVVAGVSNITSIAPGGEQTCALVNGGSVYCWGFNGLGQLGDGTTNDSLTPTMVQGLSGVISIATTDYLSCALLQGGAVQCWGSNASGQLGIGEDPSVGLPAPVPLIQASAVAAGGAHTCALVSGGKAMCWGANSYGALGDGTNTNRPSPVSVAGLSNATAISSGKAEAAGHTCALLIGGDVDCWGFNGDGELGNDSSANSFLPTRVSNVQGAVAISAGGAGYGAETCALLGDGTAQCWGDNYYGQLGNGGTATNLVPTAVKGLNSIAAVSAGGAHGCALSKDSTVDCWGYNFYGQTGSPPSDWRPNHQTLFPTKVNGLSGVTSIAAGGMHSCAVLADQSVKCWGLNYQGQLGMTGPFDSYQPLAVPDLTGVVAIASAGLEYDDFACALLSGGTVRCWGGNGYGQLGDGTLNNSAFPVDVLGVDHASAISVGEHHACALVQGGQILCWGGNDSLQLGRQIPSFSVTPINVQTLGLSTEPAIATVVSSPNPSTAGQLVTVTATIAGKAPSGTITFKDGDVVICADVAMSGGSAACSTSALNVGLHAITATYGGDANNAAVTSPVLTQLVYAGFVSLSPVRILDTRAGYTTSDGQFAGNGAVTTGGQIDLVVTGRGGVPASGVIAVVLNVTATNPTSAGYITAWPTGGAQPIASNLNFTPGVTIANLVIAKVGTGGKVSLYNSAGSTDLIADVAGYFIVGADLTSLSPGRVLDTRAGTATIDGLFQGTGALTAGQTLDLTISGRDSIPSSGVGAVILNATVTNPTAPGYLTLWPSGAAQPIASNLNFAPGLTIPNLVIGKVGANGKVSIYNSAGSTDVIADVQGWFPSVSELTALSPARVMDTRPGMLTIDGQFAGTGALSEYSTSNLTVLGRGGVPASEVDSVVLNVTVTEPSAVGYLTAWPTGSTQPNASNLNFVADQTIPNLVIAKVGSGGQVSLYNGSAGTAQVVVDVVGYFAGP